MLSKSCLAGSKLVVYEFSLR